MKASLRHTGFVLAAAAALGTAAYGLYGSGMKHGARTASTSGVATTEPINSIAAGEAATRRHIAQGLKAGQTDPANGKPILYYQDPMVPGKRFDAPAKSPFMDMMLVPVYGGGEPGSDTSTVSVSPRIQQSLGVRTADVSAGALRPQATAVGTIAWNERDQSVLQARAAGFIERLYVRATLDPITKGQAFAEVFVPEWVAAQEEFLALKHAAGDDTALVNAARQRMKLVGMDDVQIARVDAGDAVLARLTLVAPSSGVIAELVAREGMSVASGTLLARINGIASVWALAELPESQAAGVRRGAKVEARAPGAPGTVFRGTVQALLPELNPVTRTLKARIELANPGAALSPGMFVTLEFMDTDAEPALLIPTEALIQTGRRSVVMLADEGGHFTPVEVEAGAESGGQTKIKRGLKLGQRVVVSSQFLIDSEASLRGVEARLNDGSTGSGARP